jgi:hypothetical protein
MLTLVGVKELVPEDEYIVRTLNVVQIECCPPVIWSRAPQPTPATPADYEMMMEYEMKEGEATDEMMRYRDPSKRDQAAVTTPEKRMEVIEEEEEQQQEYEMNLVSMDKEGNRMVVLQARFDKLWVE